MRLEPLPSWGLTQLALHYEGEDLSAEARPFAAVLLVQLRMDVPPGAAADVVQKADLAVLKAAAPGLRLITAGPLAVGGAQHQHLEWTVDDKHHGSLQTLVVYVTRGSRLYTVTGTHRAASFSKIRADILSYAAQLVEAPA